MPFGLFCDLPVELVEEIYHLVWQATPVITLRRREFTRTEWTAWYDCPPHNSLYEPAGLQKHSGLPTWALTSKVSLQEAARTFNRHGILTVSMPHLPTDSQFTIPTIVLSPLTVREFHIFPSIWKYSRNPVHRHVHFGDTSEYTQRMCQDIASSTSLQVLKICIDIRNGQNDRQKLCLDKLSALKSMSTYINKIEIVVTEDFQPRALQSFYHSLIEEVKKLEGSVMEGVRADKRQIQRVVEEDGVARRRIVYERC